MMVNAENGVAATVTLIPEFGSKDPKEVTQQRRGSDMGNETEHETVAARNARLKAAVASGRVTSLTVFANDTEMAYMYDPTAPWGAFQQQDLERRLATDGHQTRHWQQHNADRESADSLRDPFTVDLDRPTVAPLAKRATAEELEQARQIVANAIAEAGRLNEARYQHPARNAYRLKPGTVIGNTTVPPTQRRSRRRRGNAGTEAPPPLLKITNEIARAAALVAEADALVATHSSSFKTSNVTRRQASTGTFWMQGLARKGLFPWGDNSTYAVFRSVRDYGAVGNGITVSHVRNLFFFLPSFLPSSLLRLLPVAARCYWLPDRTFPKSSLPPL